MVEYIAPGWEKIYEMSIKLFEMIKDEFIPDVIVGIARGGWIPGRLMSDFFDNENTANIKIEFYMDIYKTEEKPRIVQPVSTDVKDKNVLIVDDVADTGESLISAVNHMKEKGAKEVKVTALHKKPWSKFTPDYFVETTEAWVIYPWERFETVNKIVKKFEGKTKKEVEEELSKTGLSKELIQIFRHWLGFS